MVIDFGDGKWSGTTALISNAMPWREGRGVKIVEDSSVCLFC